MSEDAGQIASIGDGTWTDHNGIVIVSETGNEHYDLDHKVTLVCDSKHGVIARMSVRAEAKKSDRPRIRCPAGCGHMVTVYISKGAA